MQFTLDAIRTSRGRKLIGHEVLVKLTATTTRCIRIENDERSIVQHNGRMYAAAAELIIVGLL